MGVLAGPTKGLIETSFNVWNTFNGQTWELLEKTPQNFSGGEVWDRMQNIAGTSESIFVGVGIALVTLFFISGFVKNSINIKEKFHLDQMMRSFIRLGIAVFLVSNNFKIMGAFFDMASGLVKALNGGNIRKLELSPEIAHTIDKMWFWECIPVIILAIIALVVTIALSLTLVITVYMRFMKIFIALPLGTLAFSTFAGDREIAHSSTSYFKYVIGLALEAVAIGLGLVASTAIVNSGALDFSGLAGNSIGVVVGFLIQMIFMLATTVSVAKGASEIDHRTIGV